METSSSSKELEPLVGSKRGEEAAAVKVTLLVGGIFMFGCVGSTFIVFTKGKIAQDPTGFSEQQVSLCQMLFWIGWALASGTLMPAVDNLGRKVPCYSLLGIAIVAGMISTRATQVWLYGASLLVLGFTFPPSGLIAYLLVQESVPERLRAATTVGVNVGFSVILILMALQCGWVTRGWSWRTETLAWYAPMLVLLLLGPMFVSDPKQQVVAAQGKGGEATAEAAGGKSGLRVVFGEELRRSMFLTCICWTAASIGYYGLSYSAGNLSPNLYVNVILFALMDIVGYIIPGPMVASLGSRVTQMAGFLGTSVSLMMCAMLPQGSWMAVGCALFGRLCIDVAFSTVFLLIVECFPSSCRAAALGVANVASRLLTFAAPLCAVVPASLSCSALAGVCAAALAATWLLEVPGDRIEGSSATKVVEGLEKKIAGV